MQQAIDDDQRQRIAQLAMLEASQPTEEEARTYQTDVETVAQWRLERIARLRQDVAVKPTINHSFGAAIVEAVSQPLAGSSSGTIITWNGTWPYIAPLDLHRAAWQFLDSSSSRAGRGLSDDTLGATAGILAFGIAVVICFPASMLLLPVSRRRAKVRWSHIARIGAYGMFIPIVNAAICLGLIVVAVVSPSQAHASTNAALLMAIAGTPIMLVCWWWAAIKHYLRIPHALAVAILFTVLLSLMVPMLIATIAASIDRL